MGGRHGINAKFIKVMQAYYTFIIKDNDTVEGMQGDIHTMVDHITSTDENPMHDNCPEHRPKEKPSYKSFCFIKRFQWRKKREIIRYRCMIKNDVINQNLPETSEKTRRQYGKSMPKKPLLNRFISKIKRPSHSSMNLRLRFAKGSVEYEEFMKVIYRVSDPDLLQRCVDNKTQNMNESFHQRIWNMCKKDKCFEADQLEFSICQNILIHNLCYEHGTLLNSFGINITKSINALWNVQEKA